MNDDDDEVIRQGDGMDTEEDMWTVDLGKLFRSCEVELSDEEVESLARWMDSAISSDRSEILWDALRERRCCHDAVPMP